MQRALYRCDVFSTTPTPSPFLPLARSNYFSTSLSKLKEYQQTNSRTGTFIISRSIRLPKIYSIGQPASSPPVLTLRCQAVSGPAS